MTRAHALVPEPACARAQLFSERANEQGTESSGHRGGQGADQDLRGHLRGGLPRHLREGGRRPAPKLIEVGARFRVVKNSLTERAVDEAGVEGLKDFLEGPTAFTFVLARRRRCTAAKVLAQFRKQTDALAFKGGDDGRRDPLGRAGGRPLQAAVARGAPRPARRRRRLADHRWCAAWARWSAASPSRSSRSARRALSARGSPSRHPPRSRLREAEPEPAEEPRPPRSRSLRGAWRPRGRG